MTRFFPRDNSLIKAATRNKFINKILTLHPGKTFEEIIPKKRFDLDSIYGDPGILSRSNAHPVSKSNYQKLTSRVRYENAPKKRSWENVDHTSIQDSDISDKYVYRGEARWLDRGGKLVSPSRNVGHLYTSPQKRIAGRFMSGEKGMLVKINTGKISKVGPPTDHLGEDYPGVIDMTREEAAKLVPQTFISRGPNFERQIKPKDGVEYINAIEEVIVPDSNGKLYPMKFKTPLDKALFVDASSSLPVTAAKNRYFDPVTKKFKNKLDHLYT